jgi:uncharacterized protein (TIGR03086 family)
MIARMDASVNTKMDEREIFIAAERALTAVVAQVADDQWAVPMPPMFGMTKTTVRDVVQGHAADDQWVGHVLSAGTIEEGKAVFSDQPLTGDLKAGWRVITERAQAAAHDVENLDAVVHLSFGDYPAREYLQQITAYRGLQAWDLARAIGADDTLPEDLVRGMWAQLQPQADWWRAMGAFGPEVEVAADAPLQQRLLGLTGRQV